MCKSFVAATLFVLIGPAALAGPMPNSAPPKSVWPDTDGTQMPVVNVQLVPEPATLAMLGIGMTLAATLVRKRRRRSNGSMPKR